MAPDKSKKMLMVYKALSNDTRLRILQWLKEPEKHFPQQTQADVNEVGVCVTWIQKKAGLSQSTISQYLTLLQQAELVSVKRIGQWTYYKRNDKRIASLVDDIKHEL